MTVRVLSIVFAAGWIVFWLCFLVIGAYFLHSARVEERMLIASFPSAYPSYTARTKML